MRAAALALVFAIAGCTYGPEEQHFAIASTAVDPRIRTIGILVSHYSVRRPTGISTFPDGGASKTTYRTTTLFFGDLITATVREVGSIDIPSSIQSGAASDFLGWRGDTLYFQLQRCQSDASCASDPLRWIYRAPVIGSIENVRAKPLDLTLVPNVLYGWGDTIRLRANTHEFAVFAVGTDGKVVAAPPSDRSLRTIMGAWGGDRAQLNANATYAILSYPCQRVTMVQALVPDASGAFSAPAVGERIPSDPSGATTPPSELIVVGQIFDQVTPRTMRIVIGPAYNPPPRGTNWADTLSVVESRVRDLSCP